MHRNKTKSVIKVVETVLPIGSKPVCKLIILFVLLNGSQVVYFKFDPSLYLMSWG